MEGELDFNDILGGDGKS